MFDVGFWEVMLLGIVALLVVGPERMPGLARNLGLWIGKLRRFVQSVKQDIDQELKTEELQRILKQQAQIPELEEMVDEVKTKTRTIIHQTTQTIDPPTSTTNQNVTSSQHKKTG